MLTYDELLTIIAKQNESIEIVFLIEANNKEGIIAAWRMTEERKNVL